MPDHMTTGQIAQQLGVNPRRISDLFYQRVVSADDAPVVSGMRLIPSRKLTAIAAALRRKGWLPTHN